VRNYRNVTQLKVNQFARAELEATLRFAPFAIFSHNPSGEVLTWNDRAKELYGYEEREILTRHVSLLAPPELWEEERKHCSSALDRGTVSPKFGTTGVRQDGTRFPLELMISPVFAGGSIRTILRLTYPVIVPAKPYNCS
jgi:PAS domain S-box-containing protein